MAEELADEDLVDYEEDQDEGDDKGTDEVKKCAPMGSHPRGGHGPPSTVDWEGT